MEFVLYGWCINTGIKYINERQIVTTEFTQVDTNHFDKFFTKLKGDYTLYVSYERNFIFYFHYHGNKQIYIYFQLIYL